MAVLDPNTLLVAIALVYGVGGVLVFGGRDIQAVRGIERLWLMGSLLMTALILALVFLPSLSLWWLVPAGIALALKNELLGKALSRLTESPRAKWHGRHASILQGALLTGGITLGQNMALATSLFLLVSSWFFFGLTHQLLQKRRKRGSSAKLLGGSCTVFGLYLLAAAVDHLQAPYHALLQLSTVLPVAFIDAIMLQLGFIQVQRELQYRHLSKLAALDPLTGIFNRRTFFDLALRQLALHERQRRALSLLIIDLDHFKNINDTYGHSAGDRVLRAVAEQIADEVRQGDLFARIGGEEFCLLLPDTDSEGAREVASKLISAINTIQIDPYDSSTTLGASIGVASTIPGSTLNWQQLFDIADRRLYTAKTGGRNRVVCHDHTPA